MSLTSFETILLDCIVTAVILVCIQKALKLVNFCAVILILKMEEDMQYYQCIMLYYFNKGKTQQKHTKKICAVYGEGAVTD